MSKLYDEVLGDLVYDRGWTKNEKVVLWGNDIMIKTVVAADEYESINSNQKESYLWLKKELVNVSCKSNSLMNNYINEKAEDIKPILGLPNIPLDISDIVHPKWILIQQDGRIGILCDTLWDSHGVAIVVDRMKNIEVGPQNLIW